ncbi:hypothetical protein PAXRUDRAFT_11036 [Paxillus rubicundulus Ve08.2h10]|uniref:Uncharacterized protein n=1 Tax=Paxillus rubicundulus Ve08.2h10 TaxID=930991 RepID=A0A0D0DEU7_9AGAM|nr:hypothetical protein PAXRUDRAFT_11036 [Paxillus rubicundulus Ve08.2h10]
MSLPASPDGRFVLYNGLDGTACLWDLKDALVDRHESCDRSAVEGAEFRGYQHRGHLSLNPKGGTYAGASGSGNDNCTQSPDGKRIALSAETGQGFILDLESRSLTTTYPSRAMSVCSLAWSYDGQLLLTAADDKRLILHDVR